MYQLNLHAYISLKYFRRNLSVGRHLSSVRLVYTYIWFTGVLLSVTENTYYLSRTRDRTK